MSSHATEVEQRSGHKKEIDREKPLRSIHHPSTELGQELYDGEALCFSDDDEEEPMKRRSSRSREASKKKNVEGGAAAEMAKTRNRKKILESSDEEDDQDKQLETVSPARRRLEELISSETYQQEAEECSLNYSGRDRMGLFGKVEIGEADVAIFAHENVFGLEISVDEAHMVEVFESENDLGGVEAYGGFFQPASRLAL